MVLDHAYRCVSGLLCVNTAHKLEFIAVHGDHSFFAGPISSWDLASAVNTAFLSAFRCGEVERIVSEQQKHRGLALSLRH